MYTHRHTHTNIHTGQREDGRVSGTGEPQLVTTATRPGRPACKDGVEQKLGKTKGRE